MKFPSHYLIPEWPAPANVHALVTTRPCGNLASTADRLRLQQELALPQAPVWLEQVHGIHAVNLDSENPILTGDAAYAQTAGRICTVLTGDCLPLFLVSRRGDKVAAIHAGWRGLLAGIIDTVIDSLSVPADDLLVWLGPAIGPDHFEVGPEVYEQYITRHPDYGVGFNLAKNSRWFADIYRLARVNLQHRGVSAIYGGGLCTYCDAQRFYSYRRDKGAPGRMASLIWLSK